MAYIGQSIKNGTFTDLGFSGTFNSSTTAFSLGTQVGSPAQLLVSKNGVIQRPGTDYTLSSGGASITFTTAPASGDSIFIVEISGAIGGPMNRDLNGEELILDIDGDTSLRANTDDQIDVKLAGANDFKFTANNFNILSGSTLTVDSGATITNSGTANGFGVGKIGQVVTATTTTEVTNTSTTYADVGLSAAITPTATSSKIYVIVSLSSMGYSGSSANNISGFARLLRGSTEIGVYLNCRTDNVTAMQNGTTISANNLDSPSTTSAVTYKVQQKIVTAGNGRSISIGFGSTLSTITLMEVLA